MKRVFKRVLMTMFAVMAATMPVFAEGGDYNDGCGGSRSYSHGSRGF